MIKRVAILLAGMMLATACSAQNGTAPAPYKEGADYFAIKHPERFSRKGKVEVVEVFSYGCIHCYHFSPYAEKLRKSLPKGVVFHFVPASFSPAWEPFARAYYAAQQLGVLDRTHMELFKEKFHDHYPLNSLDDLADFYARQGVNRAAFMRAAHAPETDRELARSNRLIRDWGVEGTPTIIVDGKYRIGDVRTYDQLLKITRWLVDRQLKAGHDGH
jgi:protein dithiol oxidoreductase (disulfide-forming)